MKFIIYNSAFVFCLLGITFGAPNVMFENESTSSEAEVRGEIPLTQSTTTLTDNTVNKVILPTSEDGEKMGTEFFPSETETDITDELKAPENIVPAGIGGDTQPRTFHHLAKIHHKIDQSVSHLFYKLLSPFFPPPDYQEPHYFPHYSYHQGHDDIYRKDTFSTSESDTKANPINLAKNLFKPMATVPQYFVNHPINFKEAFGKFHHSIGKRSLDDVKNNDVEGATVVMRENPNQSFRRQPKTLYKFLERQRQGIGMVTG